MNRFKIILFCSSFIIIFLFGKIYPQNEIPIKAQSLDNSIPDVVAEDSLNLILHKQKINNIVYDSSNVVVQSLDSAKIKAYLRDKDFKYFEDPESTMTLWEKLMDWIKKQIAKLFALDSTGTVWDVLIYLLIAFAVIAILFGIYKSDIKGIFFSNKQVNGIRVSESVEDIHSIKFDELIEEAINKRNYRFAVRLNYLRTLKILSDKEIIVWKIDKTNHEYLHEIKHNSIKSNFSNITSDFESIWYGGFEINQSHYSDLQLKYNDFNSLLEKN